MADTQITGVPAHASTPSLPSPTSPIRAAVEVEILVDGDTGVPELVVNYDVVTPAQAMAAITAARAALDQAEAMIAHYAKAVAA
jgi:hypothetical protein